MKLEDLLTTYWPQTTLLLTLLVGTIGYFIKRVFDTKSMKVEINHTLYQQNRLTTVNRFFESYSDAERLWNEILIYKVFSREFNVNEMEKLTLPVLNALDKNLFQIMIYFSEDDYKKFEELVSNIRTIHIKVQEFYFENEFIMKESKEVSSFYTIRDKAFKENKKIIYELSKVMKVIFNS